MEKAVEVPAPKNLFGSYEDVAREDDKENVDHSEERYAGIPGGKMIPRRQEVKRKELDPVLSPNMRPGRTNHEHCSNTESSFFQSPPQARRKCETTSASGEKSHVVSFPIWQTPGQSAVPDVNASVDSITVMSPYVEYDSTTFSPLPHKLPDTVRKLSPQPNVNPFVKHNLGEKTTKQEKESIVLLHDIKPSLSFESAESTGSHHTSNTGTGFTVMMSQCTVEDKGTQSTPFHTKAWMPAYDATDKSDLDDTSVSTSEDSWENQNTQENQTSFSSSYNSHLDLTDDIILRPLQKRPFLNLSQHHGFSPIQEERQEDVLDETSVKRTVGLKKISPTDVVSFPFPSLDVSHNRAAFLSTCEAPFQSPDTPKKVRNNDVSMNSPIARGNRAPPPTARKGSRAPIMTEEGEHMAVLPVVSRFDNDFEIVGEIGRGSFGTVYKVTSRVDGCPYAVKVAKNAAKGKTEKDRMLKEVFALAALSDLSETGSFHIVRYHQAWIEENRLYIQTELCSSTLHWEMLHNHELQSEQRRYKVLREVLLALELIHAHGMVHLDIKPENIFIKGDRYKLGDFGLVHKISRASDGKVSLSQDNGDDIEEGDSRYMSKELLSGYEIDLTKCDIFSLGATLYEVCLGKPLEANGTGWHDIRDGKFSWPNHTTFGLRSLLQDMMHPTPSQRPSAEELLRRRSLLSEEQRNLIIEQNKVAAAAMQLNQERQRLNLLSSKRPARKLIRRATWDVDRMQSTLRETED